MREGLAENLSIIFLLTLIKGNILNHINEEYNIKVFCRFFVRKFSAVFSAKALSNVYI